MHCELYTAGLVPRVICFGDDSLGQTSLPALALSRPTDLNSEPLFSYVGVAASEQQTCVLFAPVHNGAALCLC